MLVEMDVPNTVMIMITQTLQQHLIPVLKKHSKWVKMLSYIYDSIKSSNIQTSFFFSFPSDLEVS